MYFRADSCVWERAGLQQYSQFLPVVLACWCWWSVVVSRENVACQLTTCKARSVLEWTAVEPAPHYTAPPPPWSGQVTSWQADQSSVLCEHQSLAAVDCRPPGGNGRGQQMVPGHRAVPRWEHCWEEVLDWPLVVQLRAGSWGHLILEKRTGDRLKGLKDFFFFFFSFFFFFFYTKQR